MLSSPFCTVETKRIVPRTRQLVSTVARAGHLQNVMVSPAGSESYVRRDGNRDNTIKVTLKTQHILDVIERRLPC